MASILDTEGGFGLNEEALCVYADIDRLLGKAGLSDGEEVVVSWVMKGYGLSDIAEHYGKTRQIFEILFKRAVKKIVRANNREWEECTGGTLED